MSKFDTAFENALNAINYGNFGHSPSGLMEGQHGPPRPTPGVSASSINTIQHAQMSSSQDQGGFSSYFPEAISTSGGVKSYTYPNWGIWREKESTFAWVELEVKQNRQKGASARSAFLEQSGAPTLAKYKLILQDKEFGWSASHEWSAYKGWAAPLNNIFANIYGQVQNFKDFLGKTKESVGNWDFKAALGAANAEPPYVRFDQSSVYTNTTNRAISFNFEFLSPPILSRSREMWEICSTIEQHSCAKSSNEIGFAPPGIWNIRILGPGNRELWALNFCALKQTRTTISGPWKGGYPSQISLNLDFEHLPPAFNDNGWWVQGGGGMPGGRGFNF